MTKIRKVFLSVFAATFVLALAVLFTACTNSTKATYTMTFMNGDTVVYTVSGEEGSAVDTSAADDFLEDGYTLEGWYLNADLTGEAQTIPSTMPGENVTYYANVIESVYVTITLDTNGGNWDQISFSILSGTNLMEGINANVDDPSKTGLIFGGWFIGDSQVTADTLVPAYDTTVTAKYKVEYTVEYYLQVIAEDGTTSYVLDDSLTETYTDWEGTYVAPAASVTGYTPADNDNAVESLTLSATDKVFKFYFDIGAYTLSYNANPPSGATVKGAMTDATSGYNGVVTISECGYSVEGYRFLGWATNPTAASAQYVAGDEYTVTGNAILYAIWEQGYTDRNGGSDYVFITGDNTIIFQRAGIDFEGTYTTSGDLTVFTVEVGTVEITGSLISSDYTFALYSSAQAATYTYAASYGTTTAVATLVLDGYYNATYTETDSDGATTEYVGTYLLYSASTSTYYFTSTSGGFYFRLGADSEGNAVFYMMGTEGYYGSIYLTSLYSLYATDGSYSYSALGYYYGYSITCDGFGTAVIADSNLSGTYSYDVDTYTLTISGSEYTTLQITFYEEGVEVYRVIIMPLSSFYAYFVYDADLAGTFNVSDGSSLTLDGYAYDATYTTANGTTYTGKYAYDESVIGGCYITFVDENGTTKYTFYMAEDGTVSLSNAEAGAYRYLSGLYYQSDYVIYLDGEGNAVIYDASGSTLVTIAYGTYTEDKGEYTFTLDTTKDMAEGYTIYSQIIFTIYSDDVYEVVSSTVNGGDTTTYFVEYTADNGDTLTDHANGLFEYYDGTATYTGYVYSSGTGWYYGYYYDSDAGSYVYFYFNLETDDNGNNVLVLFDLMPRTNTYYGQYGSTDTTITLYLDGLGSAVYTENSTEYTGTYTVKSEDEGIYTFTADNGEYFDFLLLISSSSSSYSYYFAVYSETYNGTLTGSDGSTLTIDGFGFSATYTDAKGNTYSGYYQFYDEDNDIIVFSSSDLDYTLYLYLSDTDTTSYTVYDRYSGTYYSASSDGVIDGEYLLYLNGGIFYLCDYYTYSYYYYIFYYYGYGSYASYYALSYSAMAYGTYTMTDEDADIFELVIVEDYNDMISTLGSQFTIKLGGELFSVFYLYDNEYDTYFTDSDGSVLALDGVGNAVYSTANGEKTSADYKVVESSDGTQVIVMGNYAFAVDYTNGTFELYATLYGSYYDYYYYYYGYGGAVVTVWEMADGTQTVSLDFTSSYYAYAGGFEYLMDADQNDIAIWFVPFISYSSGYYAYIEYIYEYEYTYTDSNSVEQTVTIHHDGLISLYYGYIVTGSQYDVTYIYEVKSGNYTITEYVYLFGSLDDYAGTYAGSIFSFAVADANGDFLNYNYYYYNYLTGYVYSYIGSNTCLYFVSGETAYDEVYVVTLGTTASISQLTKQTLTDNAGTYTLYYVEYEETLYSLYITTSEGTFSIYNESYVDEAETLRLITVYNNAYVYLILDESGASYNLDLCDLVTNVASADNNYVIKYMLVCGEKLYYVEAVYNGTYSILSAGTLGNEITGSNGSYTITFATEAAGYVATVTYDSTDGWSLSVVADTISYTATEGNVEVKFSLTEGGEVELSSVTVDGTDVLADYTLEGYVLTYSGTVTDGTITTITFATDETLTYVTRYILNYNGSEVCYYDYASDGTIEEVEVADGYTFISGTYDDTYLTVFVSYEYNEVTYYATCVITLGTSTFTLTNLSERTVNFTTSADIAVSISLLVDANGAPQAINSMTYNGSTVTAYLYETSDDKYVVVYSYYAYVLTLGAAAEEDVIDEYVISIYLYTYGSSTYLMRSGMYLVDATWTYDSEAETLTVTAINGFYAYSNGEYVLINVPSDYVVTAASGSCTVTFTVGEVGYSLLFYYSTSGVALPAVTASYTLAATNSSSVVFGYTITETSSGNTITPVSVTIGTNTYSYSSLSAVESYVYLVTFVSDSDSEDLLYLLVDLSGTDMVCYYVLSESVTSGDYRYTVYYYVNGSDAVVVSVSAMYVKADNVWTKVSVTFTAGETANTFTYTYNDVDYTVTFTYDSANDTLTATVTEVTGTVTE